MDHDTKPISNRVGFEYNFRLGITHHNPQPRTTLYKPSVPSRLRSTYLRVRPHSLKSETPLPNQGHFRSRPTISQTEGVRESKGGSGTLEKRMW